MTRSQIKPGMRLEMSCGIPPTLLKFRVSGTGRTMKCLNKGWRPRRPSLKSLDKYTIRDLEKDHNYE